MPEQNILIKFDSDTTGLQPGIDKFQQLEDIDAQLSTAFTKTNTQLNQRDVIVEQLAGNLGDYINKLKTAEKAAVGAFGAKGINEFKNAVIQNTNVIKLMVAAVGAAIQKMKGLDQSTEEYKKLSLQVEEATEILKEFSSSSTEVETHTVSLRTQLQATKEEMSILKLQGQENTEQFKKLAESAGELERRIRNTKDAVHALSSETGNLDALIQGVSTLAAGFQIAAGAEALFGTKNEEMERVLVKLYSIMAITNGIREVALNLQKQSILATKLESAWIAISNFVRTGSVTGLKASAVAKTADTAATTAQTAATIQLTVATSFATRAIQVLRAALVASGIGIIILAIGFLVSKMIEWSQATEKEIEMQNKLNAALRQTNEAILAQNDVFAEAQRDQRTAAEEEITIAEKRGASTLKLMAMKRKLADQDRTDAQDQLNNLQLTDSKVDELGTTIFASQRKIEAFSEALTEALKKEDKKFAEGLQSSIDAEKGKIDAIQGTFTKGLELIHARDAAEASSNAIEVEAAKLSYDQRLKSAQAYHEGLSEQFAQSEATYEQSLEEQKKAAIAAFAVIKNNSNLTPGEAFKAQQDLNAKILQLDQDLQIHRLQNEKSFIDGSVALVKEGSQEELFAKLASLNIQKEIELVSARDNAAAKSKINAEYYRQEFEMTRAYNVKVAQDTINTQISGINTQIQHARLEGFKETDSAIVELEKQMIDKTAQLEKAGLVLSIQNDELRAAKEKEIDEKALADKEELQRRYTDFLIQEELKRKQRINDLESQQLQNASSVIGAFGFARKALDDATFNNAMANIQAEKDAVLEQYKAGIVGLEAYTARVKELSDASAAVQIDNAQRVAERQSALMNAGLDVAIEVFSQIADAEKAKFQERGEADQDLLDKKLISQDEFAKRQDKIRRQQAEVEKEQAIFGIVIEGAKKVFQIETAAAAARAAGAARQAAGDPTGLASGIAMSALIMKEIPIVLIEEAVSIALIAARKFAKGKVKINGEGTETSDSIVARISKNESVMTAEATRRYEPALIAMNDLRFEEYIMKNFSQFSKPTMTDIPKHSDQVILMNNNFDAKEVGREVAAVIKDMPGFQLNLDEHGLTLFMRKQNELVQYVNKRYRFNK